MIRFITADPDSLRFMHYPIVDLIAILRMRRRARYECFDEGESPWDVYTWLDRAIEAGERPTKKQRRKLYKHYRREWRVFIRDHTKPHELQKGLFSDN